jgi:hypothetical protein
VIGFSKVRPLLMGMLLASPAVVYWFGMQDRPEAGGSVSPAAEVSRAPGAVVTIPVEVIATGSAPQWIQVRVEP